MAAESNGNSDGEIISAINVTPLVDVVLVLLIVLMVTASYAVSKSIPVDLPRAATGQSAEAQPLAISVDAQGGWFLDGKKVSRSQLVEQVRAAKKKDPRLRALIAADGEARHGDVVRVIDLLRREGVPRFAINVQPDEVNHGSNPTAG